jgi:hypothetical protein
MEFYDANFELPEAESFSEQNMTEFSMVSANANGNPDTDTTSDNETDSGELHSEFELNGLDNFESKLVSLLAFTSLPSNIISSDGLKTPPPCDKLNSAGSVAVPPSPSTTLPEEGSLTRSESPTEADSGEESCPSIVEPTCCDNSLSATSGAAAAAAAMFLNRISSGTSSKASIRTLPAVTCSGTTDVLAVPTTVGAAIDSATFASVVRTTGDVDAKPTIATVKTQAPRTASSARRDEAAADSSAVKVSGKIQVETTTAQLGNLPVKSITHGKLAEALAKAGFAGDIDFLYLPVDLKSRVAKGNAIINLRTETAYERFRKIFDKANARSVFAGISALSCSKVLTVTPAQLQGKEANVRKLQHSSLLMSLLGERPEWLPLLFNVDGESMPMPVEDDGPLP